MSAKLSGETADDDTTNSNNNQNNVNTQSTDSSDDNSQPDAIETSGDTTQTSGTVQTDNTLEITSVEKNTAQVDSTTTDIDDTAQGADKTSEPETNADAITDKQALNQTKTEIDTRPIPNDQTTNNTETVEPDEVADPEKLPVIPEDKTDSDEDGITDVMENKLTTDPRNPDSDGDGLSDLVELGTDINRPLDSDNDGAIDAQDEDDDNDGDLTIDEAADPNKNGLPDDARDYDQDGIPDYLDKDSNYASRDDDGDGLLNGEEKLIGTNPTLTDSDGDGLSDNYEAADEKDSDNDGTIDALDPDDDDDGVMTVMESADPNGDGNPADAVDSNDNSKPDYLDTDNTPTELPKDPPEETQETVETNKTSSGDAIADDSNGNSQKAEENEKAIDTPSDSTATNDEGKAKASDSTDEESKASDDKAAVADEQETEQQADTEEQTDNSDKVTVDTSNAKQGDSSDVRSARLYFPFRSAEPELSDSAAEYFDLVIKQLKDNPDVKIRLTGHTDSVGKGGPNRRLGRKRAEQVRDMLTKRGAPKKQIKVDSAGESEPVADNKTDAGRKKNRRVELEQIK